MDGFLYANSQVESWTTTVSPKKKKKKERKKTPIYQKQALSQ
jgi:hypothetical protein